MAGKIGNWHRGKILQHISTIAAFTPPATMSMYLATDSYDADGTGTQVTGSTTTTVNNDNTVFSQSGSGPLTNSVAAITTASRATGGEQTVVSAKFTVVGQPTQVLYYGDLTTPVVWPQDQAFTIPVGELDIDITAT